MIHVLLLIKLCEALAAQEPVKRIVHGLTKWTEHLTAKPQATVERAAPEPAAPVFEPMRTNSWVLVVKGIDPFTVKSVEPPWLGPPELPVKKASYVTNRRRSLDSGIPLGVEVYNIVGYNQNARLQEWLHAQEPRHAELKLLDKVGAVIELWEFDAWISELTFSPLTYDRVEPWTTHVTLLMRNFKIKDI